MRASQDIRCVHLRPVLLLHRLIGDWKASNGVKPSAKAFIAHEDMCALP